MPNKKKQHYIPKFYLKFFSNFDSKTHIGLLNLKNGKYVGSASIDGQNKRNSTIWLLRMMCKWPKR
jgi:hypothetical protein